MTNIYEIHSPRKTLEPVCQPIWICDYFGEPLVAGATPIQTVSAVALDSFNTIIANGKTSKKDIAKIIYSEFRGSRIKYIAYKWIVVDNDTVKWMKDREGVTGSKPFPFKTVEEMFIFSDLQGWPKPAWLDDVALEAAKIFLLSKKLSKNYMNMNRCGS